VSRWSGCCTRDSPSWAGFLAVGADALGWLPGGTGPQHVWMAGAIGVMTLAVMSRASLGHAGLPLSAGRGVMVLYLALIGAVAVRFGAGFVPGAPGMLHLAATLWIASFPGSRCSTGRS
jgi:uncharacterized protein involved in response to NO